MTIFKNVLVALCLSFFLLFFAKSESSSQLQEAALIFLKFHPAKFVVFFSCWKNKDKVAFGSKLIQEGLYLRITIISTDKDNLDKIDVTSYEKVTYFLDLNCENSEDVLKQASITKKFAQQYTWIIFATPDQNVTDIFNIFDNLKTRLDMNVKIVLPDGDNITNFNIYEVYNRGINDKVTVKKYGKLENSKITLEVYENTSFYNKRKDLRGIMIRSANVIKYKFKTSFEEYMNDPKLRNFDIYSKFHYQMFLVLRDVHGFNYNTSLRPSWFGNKSSGEDGGIAKMLNDDTADITSAGNIMRLLGTDRIDFYDFIMPYYKFRSYFYFRNPGVVKPNFYEVLKPFDNNVWYLSLLTVLVVCICIEITSLAEKKFHRDMRSQTWYTSLFVVVAVFCQQGLSVLPKHLAGKIIILSLLICSVLLYNYYTSSLVSSLISTEPEVLKTIKELYESSLKVGIELQPYMITYMMDRSKYDHYLSLLNSTKIYEEGCPNYINVPDGIAKVHKGGFAYHTESITAYPLIATTFEQESICELAEIPLIIGDSSIMTQKKSQYTKLFQISLRKMWQSGILKKLHKTWIGNKPECLSSARVISVSVNDLFLPYFLIVLGVVCSLLILVSEVAWSRMKTKRIKRQAVHAFLR